MVRLVPGDSISQERAERPQGMASSQQVTETEPSRIFQLFLVQHYTHYAKEMAWCQQVTETELCRPSESRISPLFLMLLRNQPYLVQRAPHYRIICAKIIMPDVNAMFIGYDSLQRGLREAIL